MDVTSRLVTSDDRRHGVLLFSSW